jgi:hypothetical protein
MSGAVDQAHCHAVQSHVSAPDRVSQFSSVSPSFTMSAWHSSAAVHGRLAHSVYANVCLASPAWSGAWLSIRLIAASYIA